MSPKVGSLSGAVYAVVLAIISFIMYDMGSSLDPVQHVVLAVTASAILLHCLSDYCAEVTQRGATRWSKKTPAPDANASTSTSGS
jgi:uncharacterized protein YqgC (DUF456 family)